MHSLDLNLAGRPFRNNVVLWVGYSVGLALLIAFSVWNVMAYTKYAGLLGELTGEVNSIDSQLLDLETRGVRAQNGVEKFDLDALEVQAIKANEVIRWKAFSWTGLFNRLADALPWNVRMSSIRPIFRAGGAITSDEPKGAESVPVAVDGIAKSYEDMLEMQEALFAHPNFGRVEMERFNTALNNEIVFQLRFLYYPDATPETPAIEQAELATVEADPAAEPAEAGPANQQTPSEEPEVEPASAEAPPQSAPKKPASRRVRRVVDPSDAKDEGGMP